MKRLAQRVERLEKTQGVGDDRLIIVREIIDMDGRVISCIPRCGVPDESLDQAMRPDECDKLLREIDFAKFDVRC